jgi:hypothetical protein
MSIGWIAGILILVTRTQSIDIRCDIESIEGSFRGVLKDATGRSRSFSGWTEFATALMALVRDTDNESITNPKEEK